MTDYKLRLTRYNNGSVITLLDGPREVAELVYTRKIHQHESSADYERLAAEHNTYGDMAMLAEFTRIQDNKINELKQEVAK